MSKSYRSRRCWGWLYGRSVGDSLVLVRVAGKSPRFSPTSKSQIISTCWAAGRELTPRLADKQKKHAAHSLKLLWNKCHLPCVSWQTVVLRRVARYFYIFGPILVVHTLYGYIIQDCAAIGLCWLVKKGVWDGQGSTIGRIGDILVTQRTGVRW